MGSPERYPDDSPKLRFTQPGASQAHGRTERRRARASGTRAPRRRPHADRAGWLTPIARYLLAAAAGGLLTWFAMPPHLNQPADAAHVAGAHGAQRVLDPLRTAPGQYVWPEQPAPSFPIPPYAAFLKDVLIVLDPGHVGQTDKGPGWKRGPTGLREAEVNLRVALFLREFLQAAGARVLLTREVDAELGLSDEEDLRERAEIANRAHADLLLSIHHNAAERPSANHTTLFYHKSPEHNPASLCAARHLLTGLNDALRLEEHVGCALRSDFVQYPGVGFAVLRQAQVPTVLSESSFHTNPEEERRLRDPVYNRREAYGLFMGLCRWAQAGLPRVRLLAESYPVPPAASSLPGASPPSATLSPSAAAPSPTAGRGSRGGRTARSVTASRGEGASRSLSTPRVVTVMLDDGLSSRPGVTREIKIRRDSVRVMLDGSPVKFSLDLAKRTVRVELPPQTAGRRAELFVDFENVFGQHVLHPRLELNGTEQN